MTANNYLKTFLIVVFFSLSASKSWGQLQITAPNAVFSIDFDDNLSPQQPTVMGLQDFNANAVRISEPPPVGNGRLNSNAFAFVNDGANANNAVAFGGNGPGGRGIFIGDVTNPGWYAFNIGGNRILGWQSRNNPAATSFATPGSITLRIENLTGGPISDLLISYNIFIRNNSNGRNRIRFYYSPTNVNGSYTEINTMALSSPDNADATPTWIQDLRSTRISGLNIPNNGFFFIRWFLEHQGGGPEDRDELGLDNITVSSAVPRSSNPNSDLIWSYEGFDYYLGYTGGGIFTAAGKGIVTNAAEFASFPLSLNTINTNAVDNRYTITNSPFSLGWAGDWRASNPIGTNLLVTIGQDNVSAGPPIIAQPSIPITSDNERISLINSGMYLTGGDGRSIGRRLQTSTAGYMYQYVATSPSANTPCQTPGVNCPYISPLTLIPSINYGFPGSNVFEFPNPAWHTPFTQFPNVTGISSTYNTLVGSQGSTVWVGAMLRKNHDNDEPVFISLHKNNANPADISAANTVQIGYFGQAPVGGFRHWGVRVNNTVYSSNNVNSRITTLGAPTRLTNAERTFDLLVASIEFDYTAGHRVRLYIIRDIARDGTPLGAIDAGTPGNPSADAITYLADPEISFQNPCGYTNTGANFTILTEAAARITQSRLAGLAPTAADLTIIDTGWELEVPRASIGTPDLSFHSVSFYGGANNAIGGTEQSAVDEIRIAGDLNKAAANSTVVSLIRGLCSANGGRLGPSNIYEGGDFGFAASLDNNGDFIAVTADPGGGGNEIQGTNQVWAAGAGNNANNFNTVSGIPDNSVVIFRPGGASLFAGGPTINAITNGNYVYQTNSANSPNDGAYTVASQSRHQFADAWYPIYDNSDRKDGHLMIINATYQRGTFFEGIIPGLCADTQYEFSVDIINLLRNCTNTITNNVPTTGSTSEPAALASNCVAVSECNPALEPGCAQFSFAGTSPNGGSIGIGAVTTGGTNSSNDRLFSLNPEVDFLLNNEPIYTPPVSIRNDQSWRRIGLTFVTKTTLGANVRLSMRNIAPGGNGNDLAIDNISFRPCGPSADYDATDACGAGLRVNIGRAGAGLSPPEVVWEVSEDGGLTWKRLTGSQSQANLQSLPFPGKFATDPLQILTAGTYTVDDGSGTQVPFTFENGDLLRVVFAGNAPNLDNVRCSYVTPPYTVDCALLPITGLSLKVSKQAEGALLTWKPVGESNEVVKYEIERSADAQSFIKLAEQPHLLNVEEYKYVDQVPLAGRNYYRVKATEINGKVTYSKIVSIDWDGQLGVNIYPNPANQEINIAFSAPSQEGQLIEVRLLNVMGAPVGNYAYTLAEGSLNLTIPTQQLTNGLYLLEFTIGKVEKYIQKIIIKH